MTEVELPDGTILELPEGATPDQIKQAVKGYTARTGAQAHAPAQPALPARSRPVQEAPIVGPVQAPRPSTVLGQRELAKTDLEEYMRQVRSRGDSRAQGFKATTVKSMLGLKSLFTDLSDQDKAVLGAIEEESKTDPNPGVRMTGSLASGALQIATPGVAATKAGNGLLPLAMRAGQRSPILKTGVGAGLGAGATSLATTPVTEEGAGPRLLAKSKQAMTDAVISGGFSQGAAAAKGAATGMFRAKPEAEALFQQGVNPTLQQGAETGWGRFVGGLTAGSLPVKQRQQVELDDAMLQRITGGRVAPHAGGPSRADNVGLADDVMSNDYKKLFQGKRFYLTKAALADAVQAANVMTPKGALRKQAGEAQAIVQNALGDLPSNAIGHDKLRPMLQRLSYEAGQAKDPAVRGGILAARNLLIERVRNRPLSQDELVSLKEIDVRNYDLNRLKEASVGKSGAQKEGVPIHLLEGAYSKTQPMAGNTTVDELVGPAQRILGVTHNQDQARTGLLSAKRALGGAAMFGAGATGGALLGPGAALGAAAVSPLYLASLAGQSKVGAKTLLGQYPAQKAMAEFLKLSPEAKAALASQSYRLTED